MEPHIWLPGSAPPSGLTRWMDVWGPTGDSEYRVLCLSSEEVQVVCHWAGRCLPCPGPERCPYCSTGKEAMVYGFVPAVVASPVHDEAVVRLTPFALDSLLRIKAGLAGDLRGAKLKLWRKGPGTKTRVRVALEGVAAPRTYPAAWDVIPHLRRLWGCGEHYPLQLDPHAWAVASMAKVDEHGEYDPLQEGGER